jgi:hypothetical protein
MALARHVFVCLSVLYCTAQCQASTRESVFLASVSAGRYVLINLFRVVMRNPQQSCIRHQLSIVHADRAVHAGTLSTVMRGKIASDFVVFFFARIKLRLRLGRRVRNPPFIVYLGSFVSECCDVHSS